MILTEPHEMDWFAQRDGFKGWLEMHEFWKVNHPDVERFSGVLIAWDHLAQ